MKSIGQMLEQCTALIGKADTDVWEEGFLRKMVRNAVAPDWSPTSRQADVIGRIHAANFPE